ncbi:MAG: hypothetical protein ACK4YO_02805 [Candidatus Altarchaeaceae archaeon]
MKYISNFILYAIGIFAIIFSLILNFYPHFNYPFPLHVDEYDHIFLAKEIVEKENINNLTDPTGRFSMSNEMEIGYHIFLAEIFIFSNLFSEIDVKSYEFLPSILFLLYALMIFIYFHYLKLPKIYSILAIIFISLIPTNVTLLGEKLLVPVAFAFFSIPATLFLIARYENEPKNENLILFIPLISFTMLCHPPTGFATITIILAYIIDLFLRRKLLEKIKKNLKILIVIILISILAIIPLFLPYLTGKGGISSAISHAEFKSQEWVQDIINFPNYFGYLILIFSAVGIIYLGWRKNYVIPIALFLFLIDLMYYINFQKIFLFPCGRIYVYISILLSIAAAIGIYGFYLIIKNFENRNLKIFSYVFLILILVLAINEQVNKHIDPRIYPFYHIMNEKNYHDFLLIKKISDKEDIILADPWISKATVITAERKTFSYLLGASGIGEYYCNEAEKFLQNKCKDTKFLIENNIKFVYCCNCCENENLERINECIYKLKNF